MKTNEMKEKVNDFIERHEKAIAVGAWVGAVVGGGLIGWWLCDKVKIGNSIVVEHEATCNLFRDAVSKYNNRMLICDIPLADGVKATEMGKIGEEILNLSKGQDLDFTHIVALGPEVKLNN